MAGSRSGKGGRSRRETLAWRKGSHLEALSADEVAMELERIRAEGGGFLTASQVVKASRRKRAPLHPVFEWDDEAAAERYREHQARNVINSIEIVIDSQPAGPMYVNLVIENVGRVYTTLKIAISSADTRDQILGKALADLESFQRRYRHLSEFEVVMVAIDSLTGG